MAGKRPLGACGLDDAVQYPVLPKRPRVEDIHGDDNSASHDYIALDFHADKHSLKDNGDNNSDEDITVQPLSHNEWALSRSDVPSTAKKIYCVRRGLRPGFYFEWAGAEGAQAQVDRFTDNLFLSFPQGPGKKAVIKPGTLDQIIMDAVDFMNHSSQHCKYTCRGKCGIDDSSPQQTIGKPNLQSKSKKNDPNLCRECQKEAPCEIPGEHWRICYSCWSLDSTQDAIHRLARRFNLNEEQTSILELVAQGRNVFYTGAAGTGKSRVLEGIVELTKELKLMRQVVAPTGMAAINVFGTTLHTFAGWTVKMSKSSKTRLREHAHEKSVWWRLTNLDVLIIDEISMVESDTLSRLSLMMQEAHQKSSKPFGGVQVVISGDFYQLPPVLPFETCIVCGHQLEGWEQRRLVYQCAEHGIYRDQDKWSFKSPVWRACKFANIELVQVHRQTDPQLVAILGSMRKDVEWTQDQEQLLLHHEHSVVFDEAVKLMPRRQEVDSINDAHMKKLLGKSRSYRCIDDLLWVQKHPEFLDPTQPDGMSRAPFASLQHHTYAADLELKNDMQVILVQNLDIEAGLVNGTSGKIIGFAPIAAERLPRAKTGPEDAANSGERLLTHEHCNYVEDRIREFYETAESKEWPVVRFSTAKGSIIERVIWPHCGLNELGNEEPYSLLSRTQIPLIAGWALTVHKSQGMTLSNVVVSLDKCFAPGQAYVALSRARSLRNMIVQTLPNDAKLSRPEDAVQNFMQATFPE